VGALVRNALDLPGRIAEQLVSKIGQARAAAISSPTCITSRSPGLRRARPWPIIPPPSLASRASARVCPSSSCSEISTGQLSTIVMAAHLLPDAGATYVAARGDTSILRPTGTAGEGPPARSGELSLPGLACSPKSGTDHAM
jgi:hypothetical protein